MRNSLKLVDEIKGRTTDKFDIDRIIGAEIRAQRLKLNMTLFEVAEGICSPSYISKMENNTTSINYSYVGKICEKILLGGDYLEKLSIISKYVSEMVTAVYVRDEIEIKNIYRNVNAFDNYRVRIIRFIYYTYMKENRLAIIEKEKIMKLYKSLDNKEIKIFGLFTAIFDYNNYCYEDAVIVLQSIIKSSNDELILALCYEYLFLCYFKVNSRKFLLVLEKTEGKAKDLLLYDRIEEYTFFKLKYLLFNNMDEAEDVLDLLKKTRYYQTSKFLYDLSKMNKIDKNLERKGFISLFYELLYLLFVDIQSFDLEFEKKRALFNEEECLYFEYIRSKANMSNIIEDASIYCLKAIKLNSVFLISDTLESACTYYRSKCRYKSIADIIDRVKQALTKIEKI